MLARRIARRRRRGMTLVESALVLGIFLVLMFGIFEYCRFLLVLHVTTNASRDGARYASVNWDKPNTFNTTDYTDANGTVYQSIIGYTTAKMGGVDRQISGFAVAVYPVDAVGLTLTPTVIRSASLNPPTYPDPFVPDSNTPDWNAVSFPDRLAVTIKGTYRPVTPVMLLMPSTIPINVTTMMGME